MVKRKVIRKKPEKRRDPIAYQRVIWTVGHELTLFGGIWYSVYALYCVLFFYRDGSWKRLFFLDKLRPVGVIGRFKWFTLMLPYVSYRLSFIGVLASHGVTSWQNWSHLNPTIYDLMSTENFQNMVIAFVWLFSESSIFKLLPFMIVSYLHLTIKPENTKEEMTRKHALLLNCIAYSEIIVVISLLTDTILFKGAAGYTLIFYLTIFWMRLNFSPYLQTTVLSILSKMDRAVPATKMDQWRSIKQFLVERIKEGYKSREKQKEDNAIDITKPQTIQPLKG